MKKKNNKGKVKKVLLEAGCPLPINEVSQLTGLTKNQVRGTASYYDSEIVPLGEGRIALIYHAYKGRGLRVTPEKGDIKEGLIESDELFCYLWPVYIPEEVTCIDSSGQKFTIKREFSTSRKQNVITGFGKWYHKEGFKQGDDIIFRCRNLKEREFEIYRLPAKERNEKKIAHQNKKLQNLVYDILKYTSNKYENAYYLIRKCILKDLYLEEVLPDGLLQAIKDAKYLLIFEQQYPMISYFNIGIKKYFHSHKGKYHLVSIMEDEIMGKYAYCTQCERIMLWDEKRGWRPVRKENFLDIFLDESFFKKK
ncbi:hypothetical protein J7K97_05825 [Candidatus Aerophobetes bacterium]|nr:hypothetical protein [Candidatus Aerophobetes bacterium]